MNRIVAFNEIIFACVYDISDTNGPGANFLSNIDSGLQVSIGNYSNQRNVPRHSHLQNKRILELTEEILVIISGAGTLRIYDDDRNFLDEIHFETGNVIHLLRGGHDLTFSAETKFIEVKQGPYFSPEKDKILW